MIAEVSQSKVSSVQLVPDDASTAEVVPGECPVFDSYSIIGRSLDSDLRVHDRWTSRHHCAVFLLNDLAFVHDLGSTHGTFVNGRRVLRCELHTGDKLSLGLARFLVECRPPATAEQ